MDLRPILPCIDIDKILVGIVVRQFAAICNRAMVLDGP